MGWGISWYINGLLIPEIHVVRGKTYTFVVEGGNNPDIPAKYHPFYISDDPVGGYEHKREEEKKVKALILNSKLQQPHILFLFSRPYASLLVYTDPDPVR